MENVDVEHDVRPDAPAFRSAVDEGVKQAEAGLTLPYDDVRRWILSWGTDDELMPPAE